MKTIFLVLLGEKPLVWHKQRYQNVHIFQIFGILLRFLKSQTKNFLSYKHLEITLPPTTSGFYPKIILLVVYERSDQRCGSPGSPPVPDIGFGPSFFMAKQPFPLEGKKHICLEISFTTSTYYNENV